LPSAAALCGGDGPLLDVDIAEVPVLGRVPVHNSEHTDVEIFGVCGGAGSLVGNHTSEGVGPSGGPETDCPCAELSSNDL
jgi:hypothetical protein